MAVESKPLFSPELVRQQVHHFTLPDSVEATRHRLQHWADLITSGQADSFKETALLPKFLTDIFGLTPEEVKLMWETAPPRMPFKKKRNATG